MKPILKWAGGKRWLLPLLEHIWQPYQDYRLVEPFTGGMAVSLGLNPNKSVLNDFNIHLINFYKQVQDGLKITAKFQNQSDYYYKMRAKFNSLINNKQHESPLAANIFYFLIKTGYNGLCRFNNSGEFNVPFGRHKTINYKTDFNLYQKILRNWDLTCLDFSELRLKSQDFVYADPPYDVEFTKYTARNFTWDDQIRLAHWLAEHDGPVVASNQATKRILKLYRDLNFKIMILKAPRSISCNGDRKEVQEMLAFSGFKSNIFKTIKKNILK